MIKTIELYKMIEKLEAHGYLKTSDTTDDVFDNDGNIMTSDDVKTMYKEYFCG